MSFIHQQFKCISFCILGRYLFLRLRPKSAIESTPPQSSTATLRELQSTMSSNNDPIVSVVVAEDTVVVVAFDDSDDDMQAIVHYVAKSKRKC